MTEQKKGIPKRIWKELELKLPNIDRPLATAKAKIIIEKHQVSIRLPAAIVNQMDLVDKKKSMDCSVELNKNGNIISLKCELEDE